MNPVSTKVFELSQSFSAVPEEAYRRNHPDALWNDLWSDNRPYDDEVEAANDDYSIGSLLARIENPKGLPTQMVFFGWFDLLQNTELPSNRFNWTIISKRFLDVVKQIGFIDYRLVNLRVIERSQFENVFNENPRKYENDTALNGLHYDDEMFYGFQVLPRVSLLTENSDKTNHMGKKVIWCDDINEIPFFFRESRFPGALLVNQEARDALEKAGIRGLQFTPAFE
jgi:hypothetical protein